MFMAKITITDIIDVGTGSYHNATSWQVALDPEFTQIIDQSLNDKVNVKEWHSMLPKINDNGYYADLDLLYARVKVHIDSYESPWYVLRPKSQNIQNVTITEKGVATIYTTSDVIKMQ
jgi:hypothetical protein